MVENVGKLVSAYTVLYICAGRQTWQQITGKKCCCIKAAAERRN